MVDVHHTNANLIVVLKLKTMIARTEVLSNGIGAILIASTDIKCTLINVCNGIKCIIYAYHLVRYMEIFSYQCMFHCCPPVGNHDSKNTSSFQWCWCNSDCIH